MHGQGMGCAEAAWRQMSLALDGALSPDEERALQAHLAHCPTCRAAWEALQSVSRLLSETPLAAPGVDLTVRVQERLATPEWEPVGRRRRGWQWTLGLVGSWLWLSLAPLGLAGGLALLGWLMLQQPVLVSMVIQLLAWLLLTLQVILRGLWVLGVHLVPEWWHAGISGCTLSTLMLVSLWAWLGFGYGRRRGEATKRTLAH